MHRLYIVELNAVKVKSLDSWFSLGFNVSSTTVKEISLYDSEFNDRRK